MINNFLTNLDYNASQINRTTIYSTSLGKVIGFIALISLALAFVYKLFAMIKRESMYLNSYISNDRSAVNISDF